MPFFDLIDELLTFIKKGVDLLRNVLVPIIILSQLNKIINYFKKTIPNIKNIARKLLKLKRRDTSVPNITILSSGENQEKKENKHR